MSAQENVISILQPEHSSLTAKVKGLRGEYFELEDKGQLIIARKAFSCLLEPIVEDTVTYIFDEYQQAYIMGILHRDNNSEALLNVPSKTMINCSDQLTIRSGMKTSFISNSIQNLTKKFNLHTESAAINFKDSVVKGGKLHSHIQVMNMVGDLLNTMVRQGIQKFASYVRKTEQVDQIQAGQMARKVDGLYTMNSKNTVMMSQKDTKIDGEHIHMG
jgi:hypothetical protein